MESPESPSLRRVDIHIYRAKAPGLTSRKTPETLSCLSSHWFIRQYSGFDFSKSTPAQESNDSPSTSITMAADLIKHNSTDSAHPQQAQNLLPAWVNPDWDRLLEVKTSGGSFRSWAASKVDLPPGAVFARLTGINQQWPQSYSTTQAGRDVHVELNSDIHFTNHSCDPTLEWHMDSFEIRVRRDRPLAKGERLSYFYPSTEWTLAQPFDCWCGAGEGMCCGRIEGAEKMDEELLKRYWLNGYIEELLAERKEVKAKTRVTEYVRCWQREANPECK